MKRQKAVKASFTQPGDRVDGARIMSLGEACDYLQVTPPTMYKYLKDGVVPAFKLPKSRVWKFDREKLDNWLMEQQGKGAEQ